MKVSPHPHNLLPGFCHSFLHQLIVFAIVFFSLMSKGTIVGAFFDDRHNGSPAFLLTVLVPNLFLTVSVLLYNLGPTTTMKIISNYPGAILLPGFSPFMFSTSLSNGCCPPDWKKMCKGDGKSLRLSLRWTLINLMVTVASQVFAFVFLADFAKDSGIESPWPKYLFLTIPFTLMQILFTLVFCFPVLREKCCLQNCYLCYKFCQPFCQRFQNCYRSCTNCSQVCNKNNV